MSAPERAPEAIAREIVRAKRFEWRNRKTLAVNQGELERLIADALRSAVQAERERYQAAADVANAQTERIEELAAAIRELTCRYGETRFGRCTRCGGSACAEARELVAGKPACEGRP